MLGLCHLSKRAAPDKSLRRDVKRLRSRYVLANTKERGKSVMLVGNFNTGSLGYQQKNRLNSIKV